ncbi:small acid-soluble spore protein P [Cohnella candidum]|uniref:Small acid-soluble spore protein P n=1 Tax=Cohnella candidum TaxID=2674991 RepID=A0A3G3K2A4_9BACL|nr:small acid-soluble spore protein P [Cohnella candidum]AYQ74654.1 small acid-soluble spore protein P [Cohnella candidum]
MKPRVQSVAQPGEGEAGGGNREQRSRTPTEPLSGSKKVKNRNHSRHNNGEG